MCSQFSQDFDISIFDYQHEYDDSHPVQRRVLPYKPALIVFNNQDNNIVFAEMNFSLVPSWSKEPKVKFATHNARIETVIEKPTWKKPFQFQHCVVPITTFYEPVYDGSLAGNIISFSSEVSNPMWAAGIYDIWNKENHSFSILTTTPDQFIETNGHDRSPVFLNQVDAIKWLTLKGQPEDMLHFINSKLIRPQLRVEIERPMKAGWEKRK